MPNCFQLIKIGEDEPTPFAEIDDKLWLEFEGSIPEPHDQWYRYWFDTIGLELSMGRSWTQIKQDLSSNSKMGPIVDYLSKHYTARSWYERK